jgi:uncharacterized protein (TIGR02246 family)
LEEYVVFYGLVQISLATALAVSSSTPIAAAQSCVVAQPGSTLWNENPDVAAIVDLAQQLKRASTTQNVAQIEDLYSPEVVYMTPGRPDTLGRKIIADNYSKLFAKFDVTLDVQVQEVGVCGDTAYDRAVFVATRTPKSGGTGLTIKGRVLEILRKEQGRWKSFRVMVNS